MTITLIAQECCRKYLVHNDQDPERAAVVRHLTDPYDSAWETHDPYSKGETVMLSELKEMGFQKVRVKFGEGNRRQLTHAL